MESFDADERGSLVDVINGLLDRGVVVGGDVMLSVAGVDLVFLELRALLSAVSTVREAARRDRPGGGGAPLPGAADDPGPEAGASSRAGVSGREGPTALSPGAAPSRERTQPHTPTGASGRGAEQREAHEPAAERSEAHESPSPPGLSARDPGGDTLDEMVRSLPERIDIDPDAVQRDLARIVLVLVELLRRVVEHQAVRRMDDGDLSEVQVDRMGTALVRLAEKMQELKQVFGLADDDLDVDLGPLGHVL